MSTSCADPIAAERLLEYLQGELSAADEDALEAHLFSCERCAGEAEALAGLATAVARAIPPVLSRSRFDALSGAGLVAQVSELRPGDVTRVVYPPTGRVLVLQLRGADLAEAQRVDVELRTPAGEALTRFADVPFDAARGELLVACQRHFAERFPEDIVFALERVAGEERRPLAEYTVLHRRA